MLDLSRNHLSTRSCQLQSCDKDEPNLHCVHHPRSFVKLYAPTQSLLAKRRLDCLKKKTHWENTEKRGKNFTALMEPQTKIYPGESQLRGFFQPTHKCSQWKFLWELLSINRVVFLATCDPFAAEVTALPPFQTWNANNIDVLEAKLIWLISVTHQLSLCTNQWNLFIRATTVSLLSAPAPEM